MIRIMSYNVRYFGHAWRGLGSSRESKRRVAAAIADLDPMPDVICLQEVETKSLRSRFGHVEGEETQLESFMAVFEDACHERSKGFPYQGFYFRAHTYRLRATPLYTTGVAIIVDSRRLRVGRNNVESPESITHHHVKRWADRKQSRICGHVCLQDPAAGRRFHVFNTHLSLPTPFTSGFWTERDKMGYGPNQIAEAHSLARFVSKLTDGEPFVVCGDFNSPPASPVYRYLTRDVGLTAAQAKLGHIDEEVPRGFPTAGFMHLRMHLDHLFSGNGVQWVDLEGTWPYAEGPFAGHSDHMPLVGRFELPVEARPDAPPG